VTEDPKDLGSQRMGVEANYGEGTTDASEDGITFEVTGLFLA
jgi:hypothetical protein